MKLINKIRKMGFKTETDLARWKMYRTGAQYNLDGIDRIYLPPADSPIFAG